MRTYTAILELGNDINDLAEPEYYLLLRALCASDAYAHLRTVLLAMRDGLPEISRPSARLLEEYFAGPHGAAAFATGLVTAGGAPVQADGWDVSEVSVDTHVRLGLAQLADTLRTWFQGRAVRRAWPDLCFCTLKILAACPELPQFAPLGCRLNRKAQWCRVMGQSRPQAAS